MTNPTRTRRDGWGGIGYKILKMSGRVGLRKYKDLSGTDIQSSFANSPLFNAHYPHNFNQWSKLGIYPRQNMHRIITVVYV